MRAIFPVIMLQHFSKSRTKRTKIMLGNRELEVTFSLLHQSRNEESFTLTVYYTIKIRTPVPTGKINRGFKALGELNYELISPKRGLH